MSLPAHKVLEAARVQAGLSTDELWLAYYALGGMASPSLVRSYLSDGAAMEPIDYDVLAQAINERFVERGGNHPVPYSDDLSPGPR